MKCNVIVILAGLFHELKDEKSWILKKVSVLHSLFAISAYAVLICTTFSSLSFAKCSSVCLKGAYALLFSLFRLMRFY